MSDGLSLTTIVDHQSLSRLQLILGASDLFDPSFLLFVKKKNSYVKIQLKA